MSELVRYEVNDKVAVITMDDGKANALSMAMIDALLAALARAEAEASAVVLTGRPDKFCAGFDLRVMMSGPEQAIALLGKGGELLLRLFEYPLPLVIAANGHALAGGVLVVCTGDVRFGADGAYKLGLNEVAIGLPVPLLAQIYTPTEARAAGYLDHVVAPEALADAAITEARRLGALPRAAFAGTKQRLRGAIAQQIRDGQAADIQRALGR